jgi:hypothetical protein
MATAKLAYRRGEFLIGIPRSRNNSGPDLEILRQAVRRTRLGAQKWRPIRIYNTQSDYNLLWTVSYALVIFVARYLCFGINCPPESCLPWS